MNATPASQTPAGSPIRCRVDESRFVLCLPPARRRVWKRCGVLALLLAFLITFFLACFHIFDGFLPVILAVGTLEVLLFTGVAALVAAPCLKTTFVLLSADRAVVKTVLYGRESIREYPLDANSHARQYYVPDPRGRRYESGPEGIEIGSDPYNPEVGSDLSDDSMPRFGAGLSPGELDWVEWRINRFLGKVATSNAGDAPPQSTAAPFEGVPKENVSSPGDPLVRIWEDPSGCRIVFPNSIANRSYSGVRSVVLGLAVSAYPFYALGRWALQGPRARPQLPMVLFLALVGLVAITELLKGLTRLIGSRELRIDPEWIVYSTRLFGIGLPLKLRTADVISVGTAKHGRRPARATRVAAAKGSVIRTADRELNYSEALRGLSEAEKQWIIGEVARRIEAARGTPGP